MSDRGKNAHYYTSNKYKSHFDEFDFFKADLDKLRLKKEYEQKEHDRLAHFEDMVTSSSSDDKNDVVYQIYKPIYNIYQNDYKQRVGEQKEQLNSYSRISEYLNDILDHGGLSDVQIENTKREQREILNQMDKVKEKINSISNIDPTIK